MVNIFGGWRRQGSRELKRAGPGRWFQRVKGVQRQMDSFRAMKNAGMGE